MKLFSVLGIGFLIFATSLAETSAPDEEAALKFVKEASERMYSTYDNVTQRLLSADYTALGQRLNDLNPSVDSGEFIKEIFEESEKFDIESFKDEKLKRAMKSIQRLAGEIILWDKNMNNEFNSAMDRLLGMSVYADISSYGNCTAEVAYFPDIQNIMVTSSDPQELKHYWTAWRDKNNEWARINFVTLIEGIRKAANSTGMSPSEFWLKDYNLESMKKVMFQIEPLFVKLHGFIRKQLNSKYGYSVIKNNEPIPDHLMQQVLEQTWTNNSVIDMIFPFNELPPYDKILKKNNFEADDLYKTADKFYQSLGLDPVPEDYWGSRLKMNIFHDQSVCQPGIYDKTHNVLMEYCRKVDFMTFLEAHGHMGQIYYAKEKKGLPAYFFPSYDLQYPVGEAVILSASIPKHVKALYFDADFKLTDDILMNRLLRMSIHTLFNIRLHYVHTTLMQKILDGQIELEDINIRYWKVVGGYLGVGPPNDRVNNTYDFSVKFYSDLNKNEHAQEFYTEILGYQFYEKFCKISGQFPGEPLHNCDFFGSKEVGNVLKEMMKLGSSKPLSEVLATILPENPTIDGKSLLEYYRPVDEWLTKKNEELKVTTGWRNTDKIVSKVKMSDVDGSNEGPSISDEEEARKFLDEASEKMYSAYDTVTDRLLSAGYTDFSKRLNDINPSSDAADSLKEIVKESRKFDIDNFNDTNLKHAIKSIRRSADEIILAEDAELNSAVEKLMGMSYYADITSYANCTGEALAYFPDVQKIIATSSDPQELKHYWTAWRESNNIWAKKHFVTLLNGIRDAANSTGMSPSEFWLKDYNLASMKKIMFQIKPLFKKLHGFIRKELNSKYGFSVIKNYEPIPDHLLQQVLAQTWTNNSVIDMIFPFNDLPPYDNILENNNFEAEGLYKTADKFYQSLGFDPVPEDYWGSRLNMSVYEDQGDCHAAIFDKTHEVFMEYCGKVDFRTFLQAHGYMGQIYYAREKKGLPAYFFPSYDLQYPVGEAVILSASTPKHVKALNFATDFKFTDDVLMNRLLRMSIHTLFNIRLHYVHTTLMQKILDGQYELEDVNQRYWKVIGSYLGVGPPNDRVNNTYDFPVKFYIDLNKNKQAQKFYTEILGYQFYEQFCRISGQYPAEPLHTCDFFGSKEVGNVLKEMMKLGSSKSLSEVLATILPENATIDGKSLLKYYRPVDEWLTKRNKELNVATGWRKTNKIVGKVQVFDYDEYEINEENTDFDSY